MSKIPLLRVSLAVSISLGMWMAAVAPMTASAFEYVHLTQFGSVGAGAGELSEPEGIAVDQSSGEVYVADAGNHRVEKFTASGQFIAAWGWGVADGRSQSEVCTTGCQSGLDGSGEGQFTRPAAVAVDNSDGPSQGDVYVADEATDTIEKFESNGGYLSSLTAGKSGPFHALYGVAVDASGNLWVYDSSAEVYEFGETGVELQQWNTGYGTSPGFALDASDNVYVVRGCGCTEKLSSAGQDLGELDPSSDTTTGLATDPLAGDVFVDQGGYVNEYPTKGSVPASPLASFGHGAIEAGSGVGVSTTTKKVYVAEGTADQIEVFGPPSPGLPKIESAKVSNVATASAELEAAIYTGQSDTTYRFQYGASAAYGNEIPGAGANIGSGLETVAVNQALTGLTPGTTYHYRVVADNQFGEVASPDRSFTTFDGQTGATGLPDGRVYELVSPPNKNGGDVGLGALSVTGGVDGQAAVNGEAVAYESLTSFGTSQSAGLFSTYISSRGPNGWSTQGITPPLSPATSLSFSPPYRALSDELTAGVLTWTDPPLTAGAPVGYGNLYVRDNTNRSYQLVTTTAPANDSESTFVGASADYRHVVFQTGDALTEGAVPGAENVYEWSAGRLSLVSVAPGSTVGSAGATGGGGGDVQGAVSSEGSLIFWTDSNGQLYVRRETAGSQKVNSSQRTPSLGDGSASFFGATPDGGHVYFSDEVALTNASNDNGGLYEYDTSSGGLSDLTPDSAGNPGLLGVLGYSEDGSSAYFVATDALSSGATAGQPNLYANRNGTLSFIATLSQEDSGDWALEAVDRHAAVSPDGAHAVFMSVASLTGYDNTDVSSGRLDSEVFEYDASPGGLHCVSCNPSGEQPSGPSSIPTWLNPTYNPRYLAEDGNRIFFDSEDGLVARDTNGEQDVYEWEHGGSCAQPEGCVHLISSGTSSAKSVFTDASPNGDDVFFMTSSRLVPEDTDEEIDLYDARVDGGFPLAPPPSSCLDEGCQGQQSTLASLESPPTAFVAPQIESDNRTGSTAKFTIAPLAPRAVSKFLRTGRLTLSVRVSKAGEIRADVTARRQGRMEQVASAASATDDAGTVHLVLKLTRPVRRELVSRRTPALEITVVFSRDPEPKRLTLALESAER